MWVIAQEHGITEKQEDQRRIPLFLSLFASRVISLVFAKNSRKTTGK